MSKICKCALCQLRLETKNLIRWAPAVELMAPDVGGFQTAVSYAKTAVDRSEGKHAALPDLIEAAERAERLLDAAIAPLLGCDPDWDVAIVQTRDALRSALLKAKGEAK